MRNFNFTLLFVVFSFFAFNQENRIKQANIYLKAYRYADANEIYKELFFKEKIDVFTYFDEYRKAFGAACQAKDFEFASSIDNLISVHENRTFDDLYNSFLFNLFVGNYSKVEEIGNSKPVKITLGAKKEIINAFMSEMPWINLMKDTLGSKIEFQKFNSGKGDFSPVIYDENLSFSSKRNYFGPKATLDNGSYLDQYEYSISDSSVKSLKGMNTKYHDGTAFYDKKNKVWYYAKNLKGLKNNELTRTGLFMYDENSKKESAFSFNNKAYFIAQPFLTEDGNTLYFSSDMPGTFGKADLWKSRKVNGEWTEPVNLGRTINTIEDEMFPFVNEDDFYFSSSGLPGLGGLDVFVSKIKKNEYEKPRNLGYPLNHFGDDFSVVFNKKMAGFYANNRGTKDFIDNIYAFELFDLKIDVLVNVLENLKEKSPLAGIMVVVKDESNEVIQITKTDEKGNVSLSAFRDKKYTFSVKDENYEDSELTISTLNLLTNDTLKKEMLLDPKFINLDLVVKEIESGEVLSNVDVKFIDKKTKEIIKLKTDSNGKIQTKLKRKNQFEIFTSTKGYIDNLDSISTVSDLRVLTKEILMTKIKKGVTFKIDNVLYDFAKATLREESKLELDKLSEFLLQNSNIKVELSSHTDSRGGDAANKKLSQARAQSCVDYLISKGIPKSSIVAKGYGETKLLNACKNNVKCSEEEHQINRRTEIKILSVEE